MKFRLSGITVILLTASFCFAGPVWSQDAAQPSMQPVGQSPMQTEAQPASQQGAQSGGQPATQAGASIAEAVVCQDVVDRAPVGSSDVFAKEVPKVYCFTRVVGATPGTQLTHNWYYQGALKASVKLNVGSTNYRTWSSKTMTPEWSGEWMVEVLSADGKPLDSIIFFLK